VGRVRLYRTEAIVLRRSDFGEADRLLTLYTPEWGKLRVIAKGVRKPTSRKSGHLELFTHSRLLVAKGRNLDIVTQAETLHSFRALREDLLRTGWAYYAAELLDRFVEEGIEDRPLFNLFLATLGWLCEDVVLRTAASGAGRLSASTVSLPCLPGRGRAWDHSLLQPSSGGASLLSLR
jgi:DNA repair protein RecO (recombination protein O)